MQVFLLLTLSLKIQYPVLSKGLPLVQEKVAAPLKREM